VAAADTLSDHDEGGRRTAASLRKADTGRKRHTTQAGNKAVEGVVGADAQATGLVGHRKVPLTVKGADVKYWAIGNVWR
jgi:hypothetical protein